ncbi:hypothetical protein CFC21_014726, partial [Triticum aestivum]
LSVST